MTRQWLELSVPYVQLMHIERAWCSARPPSNLSTPVKQTQLDMNSCHTHTLEPGAEVTRSWGFVSLMNWVDVLNHGKERPIHHQRIAAHSPDPIPQISAIRLPRLSHKYTKQGKILLPNQIRP